MNPYIKQYNEMIEEFGEKLSEYIKPISVGQYNDKGVNIGFLSSVEVIKSFLLTSFIKGLESEVERLEGRRMNEMSDVEGCQAFSENCGKKDEKGNWLCYYCEIWKGQQRETLSVKSEIFNTCLDQEIQLRKEAISELKTITNN